MGNRIFGTPIMPPIIRGILSLLLEHIVSERGKDCGRLLLLYLQALQEVLPLEFFSNGGLTTTNVSSKNLTASFSDFRWKIESPPTTMTFTLPSLSLNASWMNYFCLDSRYHRWSHTTAPSIRSIIWRAIRLSWWFRGQLMPSYASTSWQLFRRLLEPDILDFSCRVLTPSNSSSILSWPTSALATSCYRLQTVSFQLNKVRQRRWEILGFVLMRPQWRSGPQWRFDHIGHEEESERI